MGVKKTEDGRSDERFKKVCEIAAKVGADGVGRKKRRQVMKREAETMARQEAVAFTREAEAKGLTLVEACGMLGVGMETVREWRQKCAGGELVPFLLGRPGYDCDSLTIRQIRTVAWMVGPEVSVAYVAEMIWWVPRAIVEDVVRTYKREVVRDRVASLAALKWTTAGRVWSMDWTEPEAMIDGRYKTVLMVRDLGSGEILMTLPAEAQSAALAEKAVENLFIYFGAPLVMKSDNGPEFIEENFERMLVEYGVTHLLSPAYHPQYNGSVEAGNGSFKTHAFYEAMRHGRVGHWTCDDVYAGRMIANETSRPWGFGGPSPDRKWAERTVIDCDEWENFREMLEAERKRWVTADKDKKRERAAQERMSITKALVKCGYLVVNKAEASLKAVHG